MKKAKKKSTPIQLKLDASSAIFFHRLAEKGHATYQHDSSVPDGEIHVVAHPNASTVKFSLFTPSKIGHF